MTSISDTLTQVADTLCGYPLFIVLIGGGLFLFLYSGMVSVRRLPDALAALRENRSGDAPQRGISSAQALLSVVAATVGMGNIAGVAIALAMGGPGAIFWMWISAIVGMSTKYHEGVLAILHRSTRPDGTPVGGPMHIITSGLGRRWRPLAVTFAIAGMFGTLCIINANQLAEALATAASSAGLADDSPAIRLSLGILMALIVGSVVIGGIRRIASVATVLVPFMVTTYFIMVAYIVASDIEAVPGVFASIFSEAFSLRAGWGALAGVAIIGARRAALVNDAGVGTASIMHATSANKEPVREGLIAMLGPAIDSGFVCTLTAVALLLAGDFSQSGPQGLTAIVTCFALSSMFTYSFYGSRCAAYLFGERSSRWYTLAFTLSLILFAAVPLSAAVAMCDLFYALMAFPTMLSLILLRKSVRKATLQYFNRDNNYADTTREATA